TVSGSSIVQCASPISSEALPFIFTYSFEPGSSPTMIAASPGTTLRAASEAIRGINSRRTSSAIFFPSISSPGTGPPEIRDVEPAVIGLERGRWRCLTEAVDPGFGPRFCQTKTLRRARTKTLKTGPGVGPADALYRLVSPPHG